MEFNWFIFINLLEVSAYFGIIESIKNNNNKKKVDDDLMAKYRKNNVFQYMYVLLMLKILILVLILSTSHVILVNIFRLKISKINMPIGEINTCSTSFF